MNDILTQTGPAPDTVPMEHLEARICELAGHLTSATCQFLLLTADFRMARTLGGFPLITAEFAAGRLSYAKMRALTRIATAAIWIAFSNARVKAERRRRETVATAPR